MRRDSNEALAVRNPSDGMWAEGFAKGGAACMRACRDRNHSVERLSISTKNNLALKPGPETPGNQTVIPTGFENIVKDTFPILSHGNKVRMTQDSIAFKVPVGTTLWWRPGIHPWDLWRWNFACHARTRSGTKRYDTQHSRRDWKATTLVPEFITAETQNGLPA